MICYLQFSRVNNIISLKNQLLQGTVILIFCLLLKRCFFVSNARHLLLSKQCQFQVSNSTDDCRCRWWIGYLKSYAIYHIKTKDIIFIFPFLHLKAPFYNDILNLCKQIKSLTITCQYSLMVSPKTSPAWGKSFRSFLQQLQQQLKGIFIQCMTIQKYIFYSWHPWEYDLKFVMLCQCKDIVDIVQCKDIAGR